MEQVGAEADVAVELEELQRLFTLLRPRGERLQGRILGLLLGGVLGGTLFFFLGPHLRGVAAAWLSAGAHAAARPTELRKRGVGQRQERSWDEQNRPPAHSNLQTARFIEGRDYR